MRISDWSSDVCSSDLIENQTITLSNYDDKTFAKAVEAVTQSGDKDREKTMDFADITSENQVTAAKIAQDNRSEKRRAGKVCVGKIRSSGSQYIYKTNEQTIQKKSYKKKLTKKT